MIDVRTARALALLKRAEMILQGKEPQSEREVFVAVERYYGGELTPGECLAEIQKHIKVRP